MEVSYTEVVNLASILYNITVKESEIQQLEGYSDRNFAIQDANDPKARYVLKIVNELDSSPGRVELIDQICRAGQLYFQDSPLFRIPKLMETSSCKLSSTYRIRASRRDIIDMELDCNVKLFQYIEQSITLKAWIKLQAERELEGAKDRCLTAFRDFGAICAQLSRFFKTQQHLSGSLKCMLQDDSWQVSTCSQSLTQLANDLFPLDRLHDSPDPAVARWKRRLVDRVFEEWRKDLEPKVSRLPCCVLHGDLNTKNVLVVGDQLRPYWLIDFQDLQAGPRCVDLAIMMVYSVLESTRFFDLAEGLTLLPSAILAGYQAASIEPLTELELSLLAGLMRFRLCQSMLNGLRAFELSPGNKRLLSTNVRGWQLLEMLYEGSEEDPSFLLKEEECSGV